ncbi:placenta-specific gene 8 protein-like [Pecten maximus]|uniref:placenta-specific gene 8 protein-like n=1 Tax=Pecten maximus TaxID=6579 RepID=UPI0014580035|nr:placenta-specific gene 8 protein-like [Pecten maximus]
MEVQCQQPPQQVIVQQVVTVQPGPKILGPLKGTREWSSGLFDCFVDWKSCLLTCLFFQCAQCKNASRLGESPFTPYCTMGGTLAMRTRLRTLGGIEGTISWDSCVLSWCEACAVCQMSRELDYMGL